MGATVTGQGGGTVMEASPARFHRLLTETGVYAVTDDALGVERLLEIARSLVEAGIRLFQYRDKRSSDQERVETAASLVALVRSAGGLVIVNDRVDIAIASGADGAHLGQDDLPFDLGRKMLGPERVLGASASYLHELEPARAAGADYLGFGAVFATDTKPDAEYAGLDLLGQASAQSPLPIVGIGGITLERASAAIATGAAARRLLQAVREARVDPGGGERRAR